MCWHVCSVHTIGAMPAVMLVVNVLFWNNSNIVNYVYVKAERHIYRSPKKNTGYCQYKQKLDFQHQMPRNFDSTLYRLYGALFTSEACSMKTSPFKSFGKMLTYSYANVMG